MADRPTYTAVCVRSSGWWAISVPEVPGVHTQARRLEQAKAMATEAIALMLGVDEACFDVELAPQLPAELAASVAEVARRRAEAGEVRSAAGEAAVTAARSLVDAGLTVRDAGWVLGVSHQRVAQLLASDASRSDSR